MTEGFESALMKPDFDGEVFERKTSVKAVPKTRKADEDADGKVSDPVRMYLRRMSSVPLLTREGEVEIAKRIEEGEKEILHVVIGSPIALQEIIDVGGQPRGRSASICAKWCATTTKNPMLQPGSSHRKVLKQIDKLQTSQRGGRKAHEQVSTTKAADKGRAKLKQALEANRQEMQQTLEEMRLHKKQIDRIVLRLKALIRRTEKAETEIVTIEARLRVSRKELEASRCGASAKATPSSSLWARSNGFARRTCKRSGSCGQGEPPQNQEGRGRGKDAYRPAAPRLHRHSPRRTQG